MMKRNKVSLTLIFVILFLLVIGCLYMVKFHTDNTKKVEDKLEIDTIDNAGENERIIKPLRSGTYTGCRGFL